MSSDGEDVLIESEWAISVHGWRLRHDIEDREENKIVLIRGEPSSKPLKEILSSFSRATITPTAEESGEARPGFSTKVLCVGICAPSITVKDKDTYCKLPPGAKQAKPASVEHSTEIPGAYRNKLSRVVTPMTKSLKDSTVLYVRMTMHITRSNFQAIC